MTRFLAAVGTPIAVVAFFAAMQEPTLFLYYAGIAWFLFGAGGIAAAFMQGGRVVELEGKLADAEDDVADLTAALAETTATLADARVVIPLRPVPVAERPDLRVILPQSTGKHDHLADDDAWFSRLYDEEGNPRG
jgi:hypothetical protein